MIFTFVNEEAVLGILEEKGKSPGVQVGMAHSLLEHASVSVSMREIRVCVFLCALLPIGE